MTPIAFQSSYPSRIIFWLRIAVVSMLAGRAWQHLQWEVPYDALLGSSGLAFTHALACLYLLGAILAAVAPPSDSRWQGWAMGFFTLITGALGFLFFVSFQQKGYQLPQFFEHSAQLGAPLLLVWVLYRTSNPARVLRGVKVLVAITFLCHGLYAFGWPYPRPPHFVEMVTHSLGVTEAFAHPFLTSAGLLDFLVVLLLFVPRASRVALWYCVAWGALTSLARIAANVEVEDFASTLSRWWWETAVRTPHALLPLVGLMLMRAKTAMA